MKQYANYEDAPLIGYVVGYGHGEILDVESSGSHSLYFPTLKDAIKHAKKARLEEITFNMDNYGESRAEALEDTFTFYIGEERKGYSEVWLKEIDPYTGRVRNTDM